MLCTVGSGELFQEGDLSIARSPKPASKATEGLDGRDKDHTGGKSILVGDAGWELPVSPLEQRRAPSGKSGAAFGSCV